MNCFNESYDDFIKRNNYHEHRLYLKKQNCCDKQSCNDLADDYDKLAEKCHDTFKKYYQTDINGKITETTLCNDNENMAKNLRIKTNYYKDDSNNLSTIENNGPILTTINKKNTNNYREIGGDIKKKKSYKQKSYKKKSYKKKSYKKKSYKKKSYKKKSYKKKSYNK